MSLLLNPIRQATQAGKQANAIIEAFYHGYATVRLVGSGTRLTGLRVYGPTPSVGDVVVVDYSYGTVPIVFTAELYNEAAATLPPDLAPELDNQNESGSNILMSTLVVSNSAYGKIGTFIAGSTCAFGQPTYFNGSGYMTLGNASAISTAKIVGMCADSSVSSGSQGKFLLEGFINSSSWSWTAGAYVFLSKSTGGLVQSDPATVTNDCTVILGVAYTSTILYFRPELVIVEHA